MSKYEFSDDMQEISGLGGGYEACCRRMLAAALEWLDAHPHGDPKFHGFRGIYGVILEDNDDAKALSEAALKGAGEYGPSGAQHQAVISTALWIRANGWDAYVEKMTHPGGKAGILSDKLASKIADYERLLERVGELQAESDRRGRIIASHLLGWRKYTADNGVQKLYAPSEEAARQLGCGSRLSELVDRAIRELSEAA